MRDVYPAAILPIRRRALEVRERAEKLSSDWRLAGLCAPCSIALAVALRGDGIAAYVVRGGYRYRKAFWNHVWVMANEHIIDLTATQFHRVSRVFICPAGHVRYVIEEWFPDSNRLPDQLTREGKSFFAELVGLKPEPDTVLSAEQ